MLLPAVNRWSHSVFGLSVCLRVRDHILKYVNTISYEPIVGISPNSELRCRYDEDELIWFWGQKVTGQGHGPRSRAKVTGQGHDEGHRPRSLAKVTDQGHHETKCAQKALGILKVMRSNIRVTVSWTTFLATAHHSASLEIRRWIKWLHVEHRLQWHIWLIIQQTISYKAETKAWAHCPTDNTSIVNNTSLAFSAPD